jgi:hypothetical protein
MDDGTLNLLKWRLENERRSFAMDAPHATVTVTRELMLDLLEAVGIALART